MIVGINNFKYKCFDSQYIIFSEPYYNYNNSQLRKEKVNALETYGEHLKENK
jgi:hypothetical protein